MSSAGYVQANNNEQVMSAFDNPSNVCGHLMYGLYGRGDWHCAKYDENIGDDKKAALTVVMWCQHYRQNRSCVIEQRKETEKKE